MACGECIAGDGGGGEVGEEKEEEEGQKVGTYLFVDHCVNRSMDGHPFACLRYEPTYSSAGFSYFFSVSTVFVANNKDRVRRRERERERRGRASRW